MAHVTDTAVATLSYFLIEADAFRGQQNAKAHLFANGRQKSKVIITLQARNSYGEVVLLPVGGLEIIPYITAPGGWVSGTQPPETGILPYDEGTVRSGKTSKKKHTDSNDYQTFVRYLHLEPSVDARTVFKFAARIRVQSRVWTTNNLDVPYGGQGEGGRFNSSVQIEAVEPTQYRVGHGLVVSRPVVVFQGASSEAGGRAARVENTYVTLQNPRTANVVKIHSMQQPAYGSSLHLNKATCIGAPNSTASTPTIVGSTEMMMAYYDLLSPLRSPRDAICIAVGMIAYFNVVLKRLQQSYTYGMDVYGNRFDLSVHLHSEDPNASNQAPWGYTLTVEGVPPRSFEALASSRAAPPLGSWLSQIRMRLGSPTGHLYPNLRQQVEVVVEIQPRTNQDVSQQELDSVCLLLRNDDGTYTALQCEDNGQAQWFYRTVRNAYDYYPATSAQASAHAVSEGEALAVYTRRFYVHSRALAGTNVTLWAGITRIQGAEEYFYVTDGSETSFDEHVDISTKPIPVFGLDDYSFERELIDGEGNSDLFIWEYVLSTWVALRAVEPTGFGMIQWAVRSPSDTRASHVGYAAPGHSEVSYNPLIELGDDFRPVPSVSRIRPQSVVVVLQGGNNIPFHSQSSREQGGPRPLLFVDAYGNEHTLMIHYADTSASGSRSLRLSLATGAESRSATDDEA